MNNPKICGILFLVETPGGMTANTDLAANLIRSAASEKPIISFVTRMNASAGLWLTSPTKIIASSPMDSIGSIGTAANWMDFDGIFKKLGAEYFEFYATKATKKNNETRELLGKNKNDKPIIARLDFVNEMFHKAVQENMKINSDSVVFEGDVFFAEEAIKLGLAHSIMSIEETIDMLHQEGLKKIIKSFI